MTRRATQLHMTADQQIAELIDLISALDEAALRQPCPGREKLGDGTVGASARHTADNYQRIASFVRTSDRMSGAHEGAQHGDHRIPRFLRAIGHGPAEHAEHDRGGGQHDMGPGEHGGEYTAETIDLGAVLRQLSASRVTLAQIAELSDPQLDAVPPDGSFRFCDGRRTLEQVLAGLLKHQARQIDALRTAVA
jgi:hypothetical protein